MGICPVVMWVNLVHKELKLSINGSYKLSLAYIGFRTFSLSSLESKKSWPLFWLLEKASCHFFKILSYSFFLLNKKEFLLGRIKRLLVSPTWVSTTLCLGHSTLLEQYQKWMWLQLSLTRNSLTQNIMEIIEVWRGLTCNSNIFFAAINESIYHKLHSDHDSGNTWLISTI